MDVRATLHERARIVDILVTGGAGFIGSHLSKQLLAQGNRVTVVDNLSTGSRNNIPAGATFLELDLADRRSYASLPRGVELVYHLASQASGEVSFDDPIHDLMANSFATLSMLQWAKESGVAKFIFTSTMGVYADRLEESANESSPVLPKSFYGVNKQASEGFVRIFSEEGMRTTVVRLFNVYGPGQNMSNLKQGMLSIYLAYLMAGRPILVKGALTRVRDFVYIDDVVEALLLARTAQADGGIFNVCTGRKTSIDEALRHLKEAFGAEMNYPVEFGARTPRDIDSCWGDHSLIAATLGWRPRVGLEEGLARMVRWLRDGSLN